MRKMIEISRRLQSNEEGAAMVEYGLLVALIALVCIGAGDPRRHRPQYHLRQSRQQARGCR